jgi:ElaA protein
VIWHDRAFDQLTARELYAILALRARVFIVEQRCNYVDPDGIDPVSRHLWADDDGMVAYLRIVPAGARYPEVSIGRVIVAPDARGKGLGRELMQRGIAAAGAVPIRVQAQAYLEKLYAGLGFRRVTDVYDFDGIPHVEMVRS